jgi:hypothetical protein
MGFVDIYDKNHLPIDLYQLMNVLNIHLYHNFVVVDNLLYLMDDKILMNVLVDDIKYLLVFYQ